MSTTLDLAAFRRLYRGYQTSDRPQANCAARRINARAAGFVVTAERVPGTARPLFTLMYSLKEHP